MTGNSAAASAREASSGARPSFEEASRFLVHAGFGGGIAEIEDLRDRGLEAWFTRQIAMPRQSFVERFEAVPKIKRDFVHPLFWESAIHGEDQLRQRVAYALSQLVIVSLDEKSQWAEPFLAYADILQEEAFGNYETFIERITYSPAMGRYLDHLGNEKADPKTGSAPDENYARELLQLFTIGLVPLGEDGRALSDEETYTPEDIEGLAATFTGLNWPGLRKFRHGAPKAGDKRRYGRMVGYPEAHEQRRKRFLGFETSGANVEKSVNQALAHILAHPNVPPFVCKRLIQLLVTSNPQPGYVRRVVTAYKTGSFALPSGATVGEGKRGDMTATVGAILFDPDARGTARLTDPAFGRIREPSLRYIHLVRAFRPDWRIGEGELRRLRKIAYVGSPDAFGEQPWAAPSVFGVFPPDYQPPGSEAAAEGLVSPEMQVINAATTVGYLNVMTHSIHRAPDPMVDPDLSPLLGAAAEPAALTDVLDRRLFHGAAPRDTMKRIEKAVSMVDLRSRPAARERALDQRVRLALAMAVMTPSYAVQR